MRASSRSRLKKMWCPTACCSCASPFVFSSYRFGLVFLPPSSQSRFSCLAIPAAFCFESYVWPIGDIETQNIYPSGLVRGSSCRVWLQGMYRVFVANFALPFLRTIFFAKVVVPHVFLGGRDVPFRTPVFPHPPLEGFVSEGFVV